MTACGGWRRRRASQPVSFLFASSFAAADPGPRDCFGVDFDLQHPVTIAVTIDVEAIP